MEDLMVVVRRWINARKTWQAKKGDPNPGDVKLLVDEFTHLSEQLMSVLGTRNPEMLEALGECAMHATAHVSNPGLMK